MKFVFVEALPPKFSLGRRGSDEEESRPSTCQFTLPNTYSMRKVVAYVYYSLSGYSVIIAYLEYCTVCMYALSLNRVEDSI